MKKSLKYRIAEVIMEIFKVSGIIILSVGGGLLGYEFCSLLLYTWKTLKEMNLEWVILLPTVPLLLVFLFDWCEKTIDEGKKHNL